jgi:hypothetical protein
MALLPNPTLSCFCIRVTSLTTSARRLGLWRCPLPAGESPVPEHTLIERLLVQNFVGIPAPTIRRDAFLSVGGLDNALWYTADWDLYLKLAAIGSVYYHSSPLACFRVHKAPLRFRVAAIVPIFEINIR